MTARVHAEGRTLHDMQDQGQRVCEEKGKRDDEDTQLLFFRDNLCYHKTEWQAFTGPKRQTALSIPTWQTDRSIHTQSEWRLIASLIPTCRGMGGGSQETSLTCQRWKSLLARTQSAKLNPTGQMLPIDACRRGLARKIHLTLTESKHRLESTHTSKQTWSGRFMRCCMYIGETPSVITIFNILPA